MHTLPVQTESPAPSGATLSTNELRARGAQALILWERAFVILGINDAEKLTIEEFRRDPAAGAEAWRPVAIHEL